MSALSAGLGLTLVGVSALVVALILLFSQIMLPWMAALSTSVLMSTFGVTLLLTHPSNAHASDPARQPALAYDDVD